MISNSADSSAGNFTVLVVDDEEEFVNTLVKRLGKRGVACEGVYTGGEALVVVRNKDFDVVLLDMKLPDSDGNEVLRAIKKIKPATQVVILTGHISARDGVEGLDGGANNYLMKPVEFESLFESLQRARLGRGVMEENRVPGLGQKALRS